MILGVVRHELPGNCHMLYPYRSVVDLAGVPCGIGQREELIHHSISVDYEVGRDSVRDLATLEGLIRPLHRGPGRDMQDD